MVLNTVFLTIAIVMVSFALISIRIIFIKNGDFRGSCSSNNPMLRNELGECSVCGKKADEVCQNN